jgi:hypothetical protein
LSWIAADDRSYAMAEVNAFLVAWLSSLTCPVLNRPTATSLCGPGWSQTHWRIAAARARVRWCNSDQPDGSTEVVFCRGLHHGMVTELGRQAGVRLAQEARVDLLGVRFAGDGVAAVTLQPGLAEPGARELVLAQLCSEVSV